MPYEGQRAGKTGYVSFFEEELTRFLSECHYLKTSNPDAQSAVIAHKVAIKPVELTRKWLWASDGSRYVAAVQDGAPTTRVGYIKVSHVGFEWESYRQMQKHHTRYVDPFAISTLRDAIQTTVWMLPGSNIQYKHATTALQGFRLRLHELMRSRLNDGSASFYDTLFLLRGLSTKQTQAGLLFVRDCPQCGHRHEGAGISFSVYTEGVNCRNCGQPVFASDILGLHREFEEHGTNEMVFNRVMALLEVLMLAQRLESADYAETILFVDGLLGMYGESSWICRGLLRLYLKQKALAKAQGRSVPLVVGIAKTGQLMNHANAIYGDLEANDVLPLSLNYRRTVLHQAVDDPHRPFFSTRWGQEFIWRTGQGQPIVISVPFWTDEVDANRETIHEVDKYPELAEIIGGLNQLDCALYPSAFLPIVLAHEEASIAWEPGGRLLTEATRRALSAGEDRA
jgi:hypothetical protein